MILKIVLRLWLKCIYITKYNKIWIKCHRASFGAIQYEIIIQYKVSTYIWQKTIDYYLYYNVKFCAYNYNVIFALF